MDKSRPSSAIEIRRFNPADVGLMEIQHAQTPDLALAGDAARFAVQAVNGGPAFTAAIDGRIIGCGGLIENHPGYATAWALLAEAKGTALVAGTRIVRRVLDAARHGRIDTVVRSDFAAGHTWARLLGFRREGTMTAWGKDGADWDLYARRGGFWGGNI